VSISNEIRMAAALSRINGNNSAPPAALATPAAQLAGVRVWPAIATDVRGGQAAKVAVSLYLIIPQASEGALAV
jgi:hypothetical protein